MLSGGYFKDASETRFIEWHLVQFRHYLRGPALSIPLSATAEAGRRQGTAQVVGYVPPTQQTLGWFPGPWLEPGTAPVLHVPFKKFTTVQTKTHAKWWPLTNLVKFYKWPTNFQKTSIEPTMYFIIHLRFIHFIYAFKASINNSVQNKKFIYAAVVLRHWNGEIGASLSLAHSEHEWNASST